MTGDNATSREQRKYCLFDSNVIAGYYCPQTTKNKKMVPYIRNLIESVRSLQRDHFFYIPNICIAEVFNVFMKYSFGYNIKDPLHEKTHQKIRRQFQEDIHNAKLFYHYELSRYHVLAINLIAPIEHHFKLSRTRIIKGKKRKTTCAPAGIVDQILIAMGLHLVKIHGKNNVAIVTADERIVRIVEKCGRGISDSAQKHLKLSAASKLTGLDHNPESFPMVLDLKNPKVTDVEKIFGEFPLPVAKRYPKPDFCDKYNYNDIAFIRS